LGHATGRAFDADNQAAIVTTALQAFESIDSAEQIVTLPFEWSADQSWRRLATNSDQGDTRQARDTTPRYQSDADRVLAEARA